VFGCDRGGCAARHDSVDDVWRVALSFLVDGEMDMGERDPRACACCGATDRKTGLCKGCYAVRYCCAACAKWHWERGHKAESINQ